jgi:hypothetical protein
MKTQTPVKINTKNPQKRTQPQFKLINRILIAAFSKEKNQTKRTKI